MKNLVVYSSKTGNTKKLAEALYEFLPEGKEIKPVAEAPDPNDYSFVAVGFWIKGGEPDPDAQEYLKKIQDEREIVLFATHAAPPESEHVKNAMRIAKELAHKARIIGTFTCLGEVPEDMLEAAKAKEPQPEWIKEAEAAKGHPDKQDIEEFLHLIEDLDL